MYRIEKNSGYIHNGAREIFLIFESPDLKEIENKFEFLRKIPHCGIYQVVEIKEFYNERTLSTQTDSVKNNEIQLQNSISVSLGSQDRPSNECDDTPDSSQS
jgi:hypothetical protein